MIKVTVRLMSSTLSFDRPYSYISDVDVEPGSVVALPFGSANRRQYGVVTEVGAYNGEKLKSILFALPEPYSLTPLQLGIAEFMSERFFATFGDCARLMLPTGMELETAEFIVRGERFSQLDDEKLLAAFENSDRVALGGELDRRYLMPYIKKGFVRLVTEAVCHVSEKKERYIKRLDADIEIGLKGAKNKEKYKSILKKNDRNE